MTSVQCEARDLTFRSEHLYKNWMVPAIIEEQNIGGKHCDKLLHTEMCWDLQKKLKEVSVRENEERNSEKPPDNMLGDKGIKNSLFQSVMVTKTWDSKVHKWVSWQFEQQLWGSVFLRIA